MKKMLNSSNKKLGALLFATLVVIPLAVTVTHSAEAAFMHYEVTKMTKELSAMRTKTMCIGRFLIDVPDDAEVSYRPAFLSGWDISTYADETDSAFSIRLKERETELKTAKNEKGQVSLEVVTAVNTAGVMGKIFVFGREWTYGMENGKRIDTNYVAMHAHVRVQGVSFDLKAPIKDDEDAKELVQLTSQVRARKEDEIPRSSGFCFERGVILDPLAAAQNERVTAFVSLKGHPDVSIAVTTMAGLKPGPTLLERDEKNDLKIEYRSHFNTVRKGALSIGGIPGEELLELVSEPNGSHLQDFMWESLSKQNDVLDPYLLVEMSTGHGQSGSPVNSSFSDAAALALWNKISSSLRVRPVTVEASHASVNVSAPIGTGKLAADVCPQSGWWQCSDGGDTVDIADGRRRYFNKGDAFPQAVLLTPATLWQKVRGEQPTFQSSIPSSWKLADRRKVARKSTSAITEPAGPPIAPIHAASPGGASEHAIDVEHASVGALVASGSFCPASGWWQCDEAGSLDGTRWFATGETFPMATKQNSVTLLGTIKGSADLVRVATAWRLVRRAEATMSASAEGAPSASTGESASIDGSAGQVAAYDTPSEGA